MTLFINALTNTGAGIATFGLPDCKGGKVVIDGFLSEDPSVSMKNNFEPIISDMSSLNDFMQLAKVGTASWMSASKAAWKGTDPITVTFNFYLITYKKSQVDGTSLGNLLPVSKQATYFARLLSVTPSGDDTLFGRTLNVGVHGGYRPDYFQQNSEFTGYEDQMKDGSYYNADTGGTCSIIVNGGGKRTMYLRRMLLTDATFTPSTVRTGYWQGNVFRTSGEPLYIKVTATFKLMHAATLEDATLLFTGGSSI